MQPATASTAVPSDAGTENDDERPLPPHPSLLTTRLLADSTASHPATGAALILRAHLRADRHQRPYVALTLRLADATVTEARWWQFPHAPECCPREGIVHHFTGWAETFNGSTQLRVTDAQPLLDADLAPFALAVQRPLAEMLTEYDARVAQVTQFDAPLAALLRQILSGDNFDRFSTWPAAQYKHGAVRHGLLAHSLRVAAVAESFATVYGPTALPHDRALMIAAALLHDIGKTQTLPPIAGSALPGVALHLDHVTLGALMVQSAAEHLDTPFTPERLQALLHIILAHHGHTEWGASVEPQTVEAWLVHLADYAESRLWPYTDDAPRSSIRIAEQA